MFWLLFIGVFLSDFTHASPDPFPPIQATYPPIRGGRSLSQNHRDAWAYLRNIGAKSYSNFVSYQKTSKFQNLLETVEGHRPDIPRERKIFLLHPVIRDAISDGNIVLIDQLMPYLQFSEKQSFEIFNAIEDGLNSHEISGYNFAIIATTVFTNIPLNSQKLFSRALQILLIGDENGSGKHLSLLTKIILLNLIIKEREYPLTPKKMTVWEARNALWECSTEEDFLVVSNLWSHVDMENMSLQDSKTMGGELAISLVHWSAGQKGEDDENCPTLKRLDILHHFGGEKAFGNVREPSREKSLLHVYPNALCYAISEIAPLPIIEKLVKYGSPLEKCRPREDLEEFVENSALHVRNLREEYNLEDSDSQEFDELDEMFKLQKKRLGKGWTDKALEIMEKERRKREYAKRREESEDRERKRRRVDGEGSPNPY